MTLAEKLRNKGIGKPDFTKDELLQELEKRLTKGGYTSFIIGKHVGTNIEGGTIGDCNPFNRRYLLTCISEEGLQYETHFNTYGVEHIRISL